MDIFLWLLLLAVLVILVDFFLKNVISWSVGFLGEWWVHRLLKRKLNPEHYKIFKNLLLPSQGNSDATQIDHLVVSNFGIFCIETKSYKGWIFGNAYQKYWTQVIFKNRYKFFNPIWQNYAHTKAVDYLLQNEFSQIKIESFVVFPEADKLEIRGTYEVGNGRDTIEKILIFKRPVLSNDEVCRICGIITRSNIKNLKVRLKHILEVRKMSR